METTNEGGNKTFKSRKDRRKGNLQILGYIRSGHYQTSGNKRMKIIGKRENYSKPNYWAEISSKG